MDDATRTPTTTRAAIDRALIRARDEIRSERARMSRVHGEALDAAIRRGVAEPGADAFFVVEAVREIGAGIVGVVEVSGPHFCPASTLREIVADAAEVWGVDVRITGYVVAEVRAHFAEKGIALD